MSTERLNVALTEFQVLRNEINLKLRMIYQVYVIYFTVVALFYGYVVVNQKVDFVLAVPIVALGLFFRLIYDQLVIQRIADYIRTRISDKQIPSIIDSMATDGHKGRNQLAVMQWQQYYEDNLPRKYYKWSYFVIFVLFSIGPAIWRNLIILSSCYTTLPIWIQWLSPLFNLGAGLCMTLIIIREKF